jgi:DNA-binding response OmpR family regulator
VKFNILVVEDQKEISDIVSIYLVNEGFDYTVAEDGMSALSKFSENKYHLVILDIMLPGIDGFDVITEIRKVSNIPVIFLTAKQNEVDRIKGFDYGADDYVVKPFSTRELMQRVKANLRRTYSFSDSLIYSTGDLELNENTMQLTKSGENVKITGVEFKLLIAFFKNAGQVLSREQLISIVFGADYLGVDRNIDTYIKRIRYKIEDEPKNPKYLVTKYGVGYIFGGQQDDN